MSNIVDKIEEKVKGEEEPELTAVKVTAHYGADTQMEIWFEGPHAAAGWVLDMLLGHTSATLELTSITVVPRAQDVPRHVEDE